MGLMKRKFAHDENAFVITGAFLIGMTIAVLVGSAVVVGVYQFTQEPSVTYNISDTGFSLAGLNLDTTTLIIIAVVIVVAVVFIASWRRKPNS